LLQLPVIQAKAGYYVKFQRSTGGKPNGLDTSLRWYKVKRFPKTDLLTLGNNNQLQNIMKTSDYRVS
jgi:hypothetical protein